MMLSKLLVIPIFNQNNQVNMGNHQMNNMKVVLFFFVVWFSGLAHAHGPTPQKVDESITIASPAEKVWKIISRFDGIEDWHPQVTMTESIDETTRTITLDNGEQVTESLDDKNSDQFLISYRLLRENFEAIPVSFYTITIQAYDEGNNKTTVSWSGRFYRADTGNFPPENLNDEAAVEAMTAFASDGLQGIKDAVEK